MKHVLQYTMHTDMSEQYEDKPGILDKDKKSSKVFKIKNIFTYKLAEKLSAVLVVKSKLSPKDVMINPLI